MYNDCVSPTMPWKNFLSVPIRKKIVMFLLLGGKFSPVLENIYKYLVLSNSNYFDLP